MTKIPTGILAVIGILIFFGALIHDIIGIHFSPRTTIGPMDVLFYLIGAIFIIPHLSVVSKQKTTSITLALIGVPIVIVALIHDTLEIYFSSAITIGPVDTMVWLGGIMLMMPYLLSLSHTE